MDGYWENEPSTNSPRNAENLNFLSAGWTKIKAGTILVRTVDDFNTFVVSTNVDTTSYLSVGMKIKLTQTTVKYFIITAITSSTITLYGGTDHTLTSATITNVYYSVHKTPYGFPPEPDKWSITLIDATERTQVTSGTTVYNLGGLNISLPIGDWDVSYQVAMQIGSGSASAGQKYMSAGLSTANNTLIPLYNVTTAGGDIKFSRLFVSKRFSYKANVRTILYMNARDDAGAGNTIYFLNGGAGFPIPLILKAVCLYL